MKLSFYLFTWCLYSRMHSFHKHSPLNTSLLLLFKVIRLLSNKNSIVIKILKLYLYILEDFLHQSIQLSHSIYIYCYFFSSNSHTDVLNSLSFLSLFEKTFFPTDGIWELLQHHFHRVQDTHHSLFQLQIDDLHMFYKV